MDSIISLVISSVVLLHVIFISSCIKNVDTTNNTNNDEAYHFSIEDLSINGVSLFNTSEKFHKSFDRHILKIRQEEFQYYENDMVHSILEWVEYYDFGLQRMFYDEERTKLRLVYIQVSNCKYAETNYIMKFPGTMSYGINEKSILQNLKDNFKGKEFVENEYCDYDSKDNLTGYVLHFNINGKFFYLRFNLTENETVDSIVINRDID